MIDYKVLRIGEKGKNTSGELMTIVEYVDRENIVVEFENGYKTKTRYQTFKKGNVKNVYFKSVCGVGFIGEGIYTTTKNERAYGVWGDMLRRCYSDDINYKKAYKDCSVCKEWHNFQNFAEWYYENYYEVEGDVVCLDKDIRRKGNKIYSPKACIFVPNRINNLFKKNINVSKKSLKILLDTYTDIPLKVKNRLNRIIGIF